jgi:tRNA-Thr(GGU) m(6)t(6)A37 methyltransferase TsaA
LISNNFWSVDTGKIRKVNSDAAGGGTPDYSRLTLSPIGVVRSPFGDRAQAPRQPAAEALSHEAVIELSAGRNFEQALSDLDGFEHIWIVSWFHLNKTWKPKILPPRGPRIKRGVFATRSPHRPNPIGLSAARLLSVRGRTLRIAQTDLLDGTPVLDIKPYLPYADAFPGASAGWLDSVMAAEKSGGYGGARFAVAWSELALRQAAWLKSGHGVELKERADRVLARDAAPHPYRRISLNAAGKMQLAIKSWRVIFGIDGLAVRVESIASGYAPAALQAASDEGLHEAPAHRAFHRAWPASFASSAV